MIIGIIIFSVVQIYKVLEILPDYLYRLYNLFSQNHYIIDATKYLDIIYSSSMSVVESVSSEFITGLITVVMKIPSILFDLVFIVITSLFMLLDYQRIDKLVIAIKLFFTFNISISLANNGCKIKTIKQLKNKGINQLIRIYVPITTIINIIK